MIQTFQAANEATRRLERFARRHGVSVHALIVAARAIVYTRHTGESGIPFDTELVAVDAEATVGSLLRHIDVLQSSGRRVTAGARYRSYATHVANVLAGIVADGVDQRIGSLRMLSAAERETLVESFNQTAMPVEAATLTQLVERRVREMPDACAVVGDATSLSYADMEREAESVARTLRSHGVAEGSRVGVCLERSPRMLVALLGILKTGAAYVPLDPAFPPARLSFIADDADLAAIVTESARRSFVADIAPGVRTLSVEDVVAGEVASTAPAVRAQPDPTAVAYVLYTSGSTGRPKGVAVSHRSIVNFLTSMAREPGLTAHDRLLAVTTLSFDIAGLELWLPLVTGASVVIASRADAADGHRLAALIDSSGATMLQATPATWRLLIAAGWNGSPRLTMLCGGEALPADLAEALLPRGRALWNMYGPTETTVWSSLQRVRSGVPIGLGDPIANTQLYVISPGGEPAPFDAPGELVIGGDGVACGYHNRPELTAERFVRDPFRHVDGARVYRTGDLARRHRDGRLEYLGRGDQQIKLRGFRIELGEIEAALATFPDVAQTVAAVRHDATGEATLVAYYVAPDALETKRLRAHAAAALPEYMVPSRFMRLDAFPLTPNGKLDRNALPDFAAIVAAEAALPVAPSNATEAALAQIVAEILGCEQVSVDADFFALGGHSLRAMLLLGRVATRFGVEVSLRTFFERPTIAALAERVLRAAPANAGTAIVHDPRASAAPLSSAQEALWLLANGAPESSAYNLPVALRVRGDLDAVALQRALDAVVDRHPMLRTTFAQGPSGVEQRIGATRPVALETLDHRPLSTQTRADAVATALRAFTQRPFDLARDLLLRALLVRVAPDDSVLLLVSHHIVTDGMSFDIVIRELAQHYAGTDVASLPAIGVTFADFVRWQRQRLDAERLDALAAFWRNELAGAPTALALPTDHPRGAELDFAGARQIEHVPPAVLDGLRAVAREHGSTLYQVLLAAYAVVLHRYARQDEVVIGSPVLGRGRAELDGVVGYFVNTLALRIRLAERPAFGELLERVRTTCLAAFEHDDIPFETLVESSTGTRGVPYQTLFTLEDTASDVERIGSFDMRPMDFETGAAMFDLSLYVAERDGGLRVLLEYRTSLFDARTSAAIARQFCTLLAAIVAEPHGRIDALPLLGPEERVALLRGWNADDVSYPRDATVVDLIAEQVARTPNAVAVVSGERVLTYAELDVRARALATRLRAAGAGTGTFVGVCLDRSEHMNVALLAIGMAGAAYVPLDPAFPRARLAYIAADALLDLIVTESTLLDFVAGILDAATAERPAAARALVIALDTGATAATDVAPAGVAPARATGDDCAYVLYTSGSTGRPKGVAVRHRSLVNVLCALRGEPGIAAGDAMVAITTLSFDIASVEMWLPLIVGARVVVASRDETVDGRRLAELVRSNGVTFIQATPSTWRLLLAGGWTGAPGLRMISCGEPLVPELAQALLHHGGALWNMYGPTETTIYSTLDRVALDAPIGLGRPLANTQLYVLEPGGEPAPIGVTGELVIGGDGVALGYVGRPDLTAQRFVPDRFGPRPNALLYHSGDAVRRHADGRLEILGRIDYQVKVRGFRIELGEIEAVLAAHADVREAVASVRRDALGDDALIAYIVPRRGRRISANDLLAHLRDVLPAYMLPSRFIVLDALPTTPGGKLDRGALPAPDLEESVPATAFLAPRTDVERALARLVGEVVGRERIGIDENFFALGGHSLRAMRLLARITVDYGIEIPLRAFFARPTVAALAEHIGGATTKAVALEAIPRRPADTPAPLSPAQEALWLLERTSPGNAAYHLPVGLRVRGDVDRAALQSALDALVEHHTALRTSFAASAAGPVQRVADMRPADLRTIDLTPLATNERAGELEQRLRTFTREPFDLERDLLLRAMLVRVAAGEAVVLLVAHHIVTDGVSVDVLVRDLSNAYAAAAAGSRPRFEPPAFSFADVAVWEHARRDDERVHDLVRYWREALAGSSPVLELATDRPRSIEPDYAGDTVTCELPASLLAELRRLATAHDVTLFMLLLAAYATLLHRYTRGTDIIIGSPVAGRSREDLVETVGYFVKTLPLRVRFDGDPTFAELLGRVRDACVGAFEHADIGFDLLMSDAADVRDGAPFRTLFTLEESHGCAALGPLTAHRFDVHTATAKFDVSLYAAQHHDALRLSFEYRTALFDRATVARMAEHLETLLEGIAAQPAERVGALPLLPAAERTLVVDGWNDTARPYPRDATVHTLVRDRAARTPHAIAAELGEASITYGELDARSDALAAALAARGVGAGSFVGLCVERSFDMLVALLAILKAGAAYVPFDAGYPAERIAFMLADSRVTLLLAQRHLLDAFPPTAAVPVIALEDLARPEGGGAPPVVETTAESIAYVMYTSGSTGRPKGVIVTHRNIVRLVCNTSYVALDADATLLGYAPLPFDASTFELWGALLNGGRIALAPPGVQSVAALGAIVERHRVTTMWLTAPLFEQMVENGLDHLRAVRQIIAGGDILSASHVRRALDALPKCTIVNGYGPTENTTFTACFTVPRDWPAQRALPIGRPIANTRAYVLDAEGQPLPVGVFGELYTGGDGVASGYLDRPELTAERFVADPFVPRAGARMYRTGDRARWLPDGTLEFGGRLDHQLKINGFRIEPGEIETVLLGHASVREAVVIGRRDRLGVVRLVAFVVYASGVSADDGALRAFLVARLPPYLVPAQLIALDALPLTPSGKIDRLRLPDPGDVALAARAAAVAPRSAAERVVAGLMSSTLGVDDIGVDDSFFALGGQSLLAMRLISRLRDTFRVEVPLRTLFEQPTIAQLVATMRADEGKPGRIERIAEIVERVDAMMPDEVRSRSHATPAGT